MHVSELLAKNVGLTFPSCSLIAQGWTPLQDVMCQAGAAADQARVRLVVCEFAQVLVSHVRHHVPISHLSVN